MGEPFPHIPLTERLPEDRLDSWRKIADDLSRDVATFQRWERREGMPVHPFLGEMIPQWQPTNGMARMASELNARLNQCLERDEQGRSCLTVTLPNEAALETLAQPLAALLTANPTSQSDRAPLAKRVDDQNAFDLSPVGHVLGIKRTTSKHFGGRDDGAVPIRETMRNLQIQRLGKHRSGDVLNFKSHPRTDQASGDRVR